MLQEKTTDVAEPTTRASDSYLSAFSAEALKRALLIANNEMTTIEGLVATAEAAFEFIRNSSLETPEKNAFYQLEKQFEFYKALSGVR